MPKRRRLTDIMKVGKTVLFEDPDGDVEIWMQKPNKVEMDSIYRRANAEKARFLIRAKDHESDEWMEAYAAVLDMEDGDLTLNLAMAPDLGRARARIEAQLEFDEDGEWAKEEYLQSLYDLWNGDEDTKGLREHYALDPEGETEEGAKALEVLGELERFRQQVEAAFAVEREAVEAAWRARSPEDVTEIAVEQYLESVANSVFMNEFSRQQIFYACREPDDHLKKYFGTLDEMDELSDTVRLRLDLEITAFMQDVNEGKDSPATPDGSAPSEPPVTEGTSQDSGLVDVSA